jgi:hypothetical protein
MNLKTKHVNQRDRRRIGKDQIKYNSDTAILLTQFISWHAYYNISTYKASQQSIFVNIWRLAHVYVIHGVTSRIQIKNTSRFTLYARQLSADIKEYTCIILLLARIHDKMLNEET